MGRRLWLALTLVVLAGTACRDVVQPAPDLEPALSGSVAIPNQYIVVFDASVRDVPGQARGLMQAHGGSILFTYETALRGFAGRFSSQAAEAIARNPNVLYVEEDAEARLFTTQTNPPSWGLDRIDQESGLDNSYSYTSSGTGVNVYILDTGVRLTHNDFGGRAQYIPNGANGDFVGDTHGSAEDCHGHGSHVAGTAAGTTFGVAKNADIWAGRVVNCSGSGSVSMAIAGVDWITADGLRPAVVNMSLGYGNVQSLRDAVEASIAAGVNYAVAAGNGNFAGIPQDACGESPAGAPNAMTMGATDINDNEASFSNYGTCVDLLAPGVSITSAWFSSNTATATISGTSMATPHMTGAIARFLEVNPGASPAQVAAAFTTNATTGAISLNRTSRRNGTPNRLLNTTFIDGVAPPPPPPPPPPADAWNLQATGVKVKGAHTVNLTWDSSAGATGSVDVYRDGALIVTTANDGAHTDAIGAKGSASYVYRVCEAGGTANCSVDVTVRF